MSTIVRTKAKVIGADAGAWGPVALWPPVVAGLTAEVPAWARMWGIAIAIYAGLKWLTFASSLAARQAPWWKSAGYLFFWTGMDAEAFFGRRERVVRPRWSEWAWAAGQTAVGLLLLLAAAPRFSSTHPLVAGWLAMTGVVSMLHFGIAQMASAVWRQAGVNARHIMHKPVLATSLADFWGRRWNLAFRDVAHQFVFQPLLPVIGGPGAMMGVFLVSGLVHDVVISGTAGAGWGLPTLYFLIQGIGALVERSALGRGLGLGRGVPGWLFAAAIVAGPAGLLFHPPFIARVVTPMVEAIAGVAV